MHNSFVLKNNLIQMAHSNKIAIAKVIDVLRDKLALKRIYRTKRRLFILALIAAMLIVAAYELPVLKEMDWGEEDIYFKWTVKNLDYYTGHNYEVLKKELQEDIALDDGLGCKMPQLNPFHEDARNLEREEPQPDCSGIEWVECFLSECYITKDILKSFKNVTCSFQDIHFVTDQRYELGLTKEVVGGQQYILTKTDHVRVRCLGTDSTPYPVSWVGYKTGFRRLPPMPSPCCGPHLNVLMLCLNSASKSAFIRRMPKSYATLQAMDTIFFNGYNVVDGGSALLPILTGRSEYELPELRKSFTDYFLNEKQFIFSPLSNYGYRTAYFEDVPSLGTLQKRFNGFRVPPADHYLRPLFLDAFFDKIDNRCLGNQPLHSVVLNITFQFFLLEGFRFAYTFIGGHSNNDLNLLYTMDDELSYFLHRIQQGGTLDNTALFIIGEHGQRFGLMRETPQGSLEERLPLMAIVVPPDLKRTRPEAVEALKANADVLITPFDIHSTLTDLLGIGNVRNQLKITSTSLPRGMTLLQPIPASRSCGEAGVPAHWCACVTWIPVKPDEPIYRQVARVTADYIRNLTANNRYICQDRTLDSIVSVYRQSTKKTCNSHPYCGRYRTTIIMGPRRTVFEATLKHFATPGDDQFQISQMDISRINGNPDGSSCLFPDLQHLEEFCMCTDWFLNE